MINLVASLMYFLAMCIHLNRFLHRSTTEREIKRKENGKVPLLDAAPREGFGRSALRHKLRVEPLCHQHCVYHVVSFDTTGSHSSHAKHGDSFAKDELGSILEDFSCVRVLTKLSFA